MAHRFAYMHLIGPIPEGLEVHLFLGTQADNVRDAVAKGRVAMRGHWTGASSPRGVDHWYARLNEEKVRAIMRLSKTTSQRELGRMFNVHHMTISAVLHGQTWRHVTRLPIPE